MRSAQDQIQLQQLRRLLLGSEQIDVSHDQLAFYAEGQNRRLVQSGNWLLVQPGTWIFSIRSSRFSLNSGRIRSGCG